MNAKIQPASPKLEAFYHDALMAVAKIAREKYGDEPKVLHMIAGLSKAVGMMVCACYPNERDLAPSHLQSGRAMIAEALNRMHASGGAALAAIPDKHYWLLAKGRLRPQEPLYAIQLLKPGTEYVIAEAEGDSIEECVAEVLAKTPR